MRYMVRSDMEGASGIVSLREGPYLEAVRRLYSREMSDDHTLVFRGGSATDVWSGYWKLKLICQSDMATGRKERL